jgi:hypothetical protein
MFEAIFWDDARTAAAPWETEHARHLMLLRGGDDVRF